MFYGQYHHQMDDKGRLRIPPAFRKLLGDNPMIFCSFEKCLFIYTGEDFDRLVKERFSHADLLDTDMNDIKAHMQAIDYKKIVAPFTASNGN